VRYPPAATAGMAGLVGPLLLTGEATFLPYSLLELDGERLRTEDRHEGYRDVVIVRFGIEHRASTGVRLRLGYRFDPDPFRLVIAEVRDDDPQEAVMEDARFADERHVLTAGGGFLVEDALLLDLAADWGKTKKAGSNVDQSDDIARFFLTTSYRF
jgi:long-subunit fatty acid transport protein